MIACPCKNIPEGKLKEELAKVSGPLTPGQAGVLHKKLGGPGSCCGQCLKPEGDRLFRQIVNVHNENHAALKL